jgi:hypothetical protein
MWSSLRTSSSFACLFLSALLAGACSGGDDQTKEGECQIVGGTSPDSLSSFTCRSDFDALASEPLDSSLPGAQSVKVVLDLADGNALYFQNSKKFKIHYEFASTHLSGGGRPLIPTLSDFNQTEYFSPSRRFVLGAVTYYSGPGVFALELAPYDTASAELMNTLYTRVRKASYFGPQLVFHPTSDTVAAEAARLPASVPQKSTDELYAAIDYQPLNLGTAVGRLHFLSAASLAATYVPYRDIVVLDHVPNDISVVQGIITEEFQTPLSHLNVLSQNRHNPNMGLRGATTRPELLALDGKWVRLEVGAQSYQVTVLLGNGDGTFAAPVHQTVAAKPAFIGIADLSGDGFADLVVGYIDLKGISVLLGDGSGRFAAPKDYPVGAGPRGAAIADLNGDQKPDIATRNFVDGNVSVLLNDGSGRFGGAKNFPAGSDPRAVAIGDIDGDAKPDLVVANNGDATLSVLRGDGSGGFATPTTLSAGMAPRAVLIVDVDGDGKLDVLSANSGGNTVSLYRRAPAGGFLPVKTLATGMAPVALVVADFDGNGRLDLATGNAQSNDVSVHLSDGAGSFSAPSTVAVGKLPRSLTLADVNGDTQLDLVATNDDSNNLSILINR